MRLTKKVGKLAFIDRSLFRLLETYVMSMLAKKKQILQILVANLNNSEPQVVHSEMIADKLEMSVNETCQLLKIMHQLGMVISDGEGQKSLITREGLKCVDQEFGGTVCSV